MVCLQTAPRGRVREGPISLANKHSIRIHCRQKKKSEKSVTQLMSLGSNAGCLKALMSLMALMLLSISIIYYWILLEQ